MSLVATECPMVPSDMTWNRMIPPTTSFLHQASLPVGRYLETQTHKNKVGAEGLVLWGV